MLKMDNVQYALLNIIVMVQVKKHVKMENILIPQVKHHAKIVKQDIIVKTEKKKNVLVVNIQVQIVLIVVSVLLDIIAPG